MRNGEDLGTKQNKGERLLLGPGTEGTVGQSYLNWGSGRRILLRSGMGILGKKWELRGNN